MHAQDVSLCTSYAIINTAIPTPDTTGSGSVPAVAALQNALAENPHASPPVRAAVTDMTSVYEARIAAHGKVRARGLAEPPPQWRAHKAASAEVWAVRAGRRVDRGIYMAAVIGNAGDVQRPSGRASSLTVLPYWPSISETDFAIACR